MKRLVSWMAGLACLFAVLASHTLASNAAELLTVGSKAPELNIEHWLNKDNGRFKPVTKFQPGKVYVVEFWATWCGPCIQGMPHLIELQKEYAEKGVQFISVTNEELETVEEFLDRPVPARGTDKESKAQTFADLTKGYSLTADPDESTDKSYMQASIQPGIPTAFIVGKDAKIEWIGHPSEMDMVLQAVVTDSWDREPFGKEFLAKQQAELARVELSEALQKRDYAKATELIDKRMAAVEDTQEKLQLSLMKVQIGLAQNKMDEATARLKDTYAVAQGQVAMIDLVSWHIYEQAEQRKIDMTPLLKVALSESEKVIPTAKGEQLGSLLDTVGHVAYKLGDLDKAIQLVSQATEHAAGENKEFSKQFLAELKTEKAEKSKGAEKGKGTDKSSPADQPKAKK